MGKQSLTDRQKLFVQHYCQELNASAAARKAGYASRTAGRQGHELLKNPKVREAIAQYTEAQISQLEISPRRIMEEIVHLALNRDEKASQAVKLKALSYLASYVGISPETPRGTAQKILTTSTGATRKGGNNDQLVTTSPPDERGGVSTPQSDPLDATDGIVLDVQPES